VKYCILCIGSYGDVFPYVALALKLKEEGHEVRIAAHPQAQPLCSRLGLDFSPVGGDLADLPQSETKGIFEATGLKKLPAVWKLMRLFKKMIPIQLTDSLHAAKGADVLIYSPAAFAGPHLAEYLDVPGFRMVLQPELRTKEHPSCLVPMPNCLGAFGNRLSHVISEQSLWQPIRSEVNRWRKKELAMQKSPLG
jgi:sterol 3beta-glucosyltransferase